MFYIGIAIAVAVGVFFGMSFYSDSQGTWNKIKIVLRKIKDYLKNKIKNFFKVVYKIFLWILCIAVLAGIVYLLYLFIRWLIESDVYLFVIFYVGFPLVFMLFILFIKWIKDKISKKSKKSD